jgi:hypothetical protein
MKYVFNDGGSAAAGYTNESGDCVPRAIAIVTGKPYQEVCDALYDLAVAYSHENDDKAARAMRRAVAKGGPHWKWHPNPTSGCSVGIYKQYLRDLNWHQYTPIPKSDGTAWLLIDRFAELEGSYLVSLCGHLTAVIDGTVHDSWNPVESAAFPVTYFWHLPNVPENVDLIFPPNDQSGVQHE